MSNKPLSGSEAAGFSPAASGSHSEVALTITGLNKSFGGTQALSDASLTVRKGTVHALLGGNGSGKSTSIKILAAVYTADSGDLTIFGKPYSLSGYTSQTAQQAGLRFVHQDLGLFPELSIEENFALDAGYPLRSYGGVDWKKLRAHVSRLLTEYEIDADPWAPVQSLRPSDRTMVAIARALQDQVEGEDLILVLDEPTASLALHESTRLLEQVRRRADKGQTVVMVSHRLQEVLSVAHDFTVFRDGKVVGTLTDASPTEDELVEIMAGSLVKSLRPTGSQSHARNEEVVVLKSIHGGPLRGVNLTVHAGEILGIAGLVGSGRSSILLNIFGSVKPSKGTIILNGKEFTPKHIDEAMDAGVAMVPENRVQDAAFSDLSVRENIAASVLRENWVRGWMSRTKERGIARKLIERFSVKVAGPDALFSSMSGGNQQKVVLARWMQRNPSLLLLDEPTQGVDVMSRADIYSVIREAAAAGMAVIVASSDVSELHALSDRVAILRSGRITDEVVAGELEIDYLNRLVLKDPTGAIPVVKSATARKARS
ncbi:sugar ABC transporter ATP-binding protein [Aurantimicrobium photophilum]|uniref:Ribose import ATP-binding protein RbsA n=1 Tax=Aurantimicrobium photophilum TaxID=1987356 RepID=A0A2Z3S0Q2_9MICO|nr:sugar ABC transporter ATP-binding protein [Aurantimicrobium photophilum]AWR20678.1 Ribose import ATP-binding protein RbsA [Aurantimicrobium photophilum]